MVDHPSPTHLMVAVKEGGARECLELLQRGENVNGSDAHGTTAFLLAAKLGKRECLEVLLTNGANVAWSAMDGRTALAWTAWEGHKDCLEFLLHANVHPDRVALFGAAGMGRRDFLELLLQYGADASDVDEDAYTALAWAALGGHKDCLEFLLQYGVEADGCAVRVAAANGQSECLEILLQSGGDINATYVDGAYISTPLTEAVMRGNRECIEILIKHGLVINARDQHGRTALSRLVTSDARKEWVEILITCGADVNVVDNEGFTPLMLEVKNGEFDICDIDILLQHGADPYYKDAEGLRVLDWARKEKRGADNQERGRKVIKFFEDLEYAKMRHEQIFPSLFQDITEFVFHPRQLKRRGFFDDV